MRVLLTLLSVALAVCCWPVRGPAWPAPGGREQAGSAAGGAKPNRRGGRMTGWGVLLIPGRARAVRRRRGRAVLSVLDALAAGLEVGLPAGDALREACRATDDPTVRAAFGSPHGRDPVPAEQEMDRRGGDGLDGVVLLARAWRLSERLGTPLASSVRAVAVLLRSEIAARRAVAVAMSEARATVLVLVALPLLGPLLAVGVGVSPVDLFGTVPGAASAALGGALVALGLWWMRRLLRRVARAGDAW